MNPIVFYRHYFKDIHNNVQCVQTVLNYQESGIANSPVFVQYLGSVQVTDNVSDMSGN